MWEPGHTTVRDLWDAFARYPYLPRLRDIHVLMATVKHGPATMDWQNESFATAAGWENGKYLDLTAGSIPSVVTSTTLVVKPSAAEQQLKQAPYVAPSDDVNEGEGGEAATQDVSAPPKLAGESQPTRFYGRVSLDPSRYARDFGRVQQEILAQLADIDTSLQITVEIEATRPHGFKEATIRNVSENAQTLRFDHHEFE